MDKSGPTVAQEIARAACAFEQRLTGRAPRAVAVVLSGETLVITLHGVLSPAERALAQTPDGAAEVQEYHRRLFASSFDELRQEIKRITGVEVREVAAEIEPATGTVVKAFTTGTVVQVFLLARNIPAETWSGSRRDGQASGDGNVTDGVATKLGGEPLVFARGQVGLLELLHRRD